jgi:nucleotide-binding universal stress UspA family protein
MDMKRILVATDFSELSGAAVKAAADLARQAGGHLTVLHVMMPTCIAAGRVPRLAGTVQVQ